MKIVTYCIIYVLCIVYVLYYYTSMMLAGSDILYGDYIICCVVYVLYYYIIALYILYSCWVKKMFSHCVFYQIMFVCNECCV